eukprot:Opistho-2@33004
MSRRRARSNSFRGKEMHDNMHGSCDVVDELLGSGDEGESGESSKPPVGNQRGHLRKASGIPAGFKETVTIKQVIKRRSGDMSGAYDTKLSPDDIEEFRELVSKYMNRTIEEIMRFREDENCATDRKQLEDLAIKLYLYFESKERNSLKLSLSEFGLKCTVDDVLHKLIRTGDEPKLHG